MSDASNFNRINRAIEIFESYGFDIDINSKEFFVKGIGVFPTAETLFAAATCFDIGMTRGKSEAYIEMAEESDEPEPEEEFINNVIDSGWYVVDYGLGQTTDFFDGECWSNLVDLYGGECPWAAPLQVIGKV